MPEEAEAYDAWRRKAWRPVAKAIMVDTAKSVRVILPEEYDRVRARFPNAIEKVKSRFSGGVGMWR